MSMRLYYILAEDGKTPIATQDMMLWAEWFGKNHPVHVATSHDEAKGIHVSTVFLSLDHNHWGEGAPVLFETMVFGGPHNEKMDRYCTWEEAERGHKIMCGRVGIAWSNHEDKGSMTA